MKKYIIPVASAFIAAGAIASPYDKTSGFPPGAVGIDGMPIEYWGVNDLGTLAPDNEGNSRTSAISLDGRTIIGRTSSNYNAYQAYAYDVATNKMIYLGTLRSDNDGESAALAISADGNVIIGYADTDSGALQAFMHRSGDTALTGLGTLRADNTGLSYARALSADGNVIVGQAATDTESLGQAFRYDNATGAMTGLGSLRTDNTGASSARIVSADGRVTAGEADTNGNNGMQAFRHNVGDSKMTGLGSLQADNLGNSFARAISADGRIIAGTASTSYVIDGGTNTFSELQAFRHTEGDSKVTGLGTLRTDNRGSSDVLAMTADGSVMAGYAATDNGATQAFRMNATDSKMTGLGSLKADGTGDSRVLALSADGRIAVGYSESDTSLYQGFVHSQDDNKMIGLYSLRADNGGWSEANSISADGKVIAGKSQTDSGQSHSVFWRMRGEFTRPIDPDETSYVVNRSATTAFHVLDLYQSALYSLSESRCQAGDSRYCVGAFSQFDQVRSNHRVATGLFGSFRLPAENWTLGAAMNFANNTRLTDGYDTRSGNNPGVGAYVRYQSNPDNSGFSGELSGAFLNQDVTIQREQRSNTEAGRGDAKIEAYRVKLAATYGINLSDDTQLLPTAALGWHDVNRSGYTEKGDLDFPATYDRMGNKSTDLTLGVDAKHRFSDLFVADGGIGADINLSRQRDAFTGRFDYMGEFYYANDDGDSQSVTPYAYAGLDVNIRPDSTLRASAGWHQTDYTNNALQVGLSYSLHW